MSKIYRAPIIRALLLTNLFFIPSSRCYSASSLPGIYGILGIIPGLGHVTQGEVGEGLGWFGMTIGLLATGNPHAAQIGFDLWMYNMYDAYKDAGAVNATQFSVYENYLANFVPTNILDPIGGPIVGVGLLAGSSRGYPTLRSPISMFEFTFVGLGEEALFRGFLYPGLSSIFGGSKYLGAIVSSALFSAVHNNANSVAMSVRFIGGLLFCWQAERNKYDLRKNIFAHTWYDIFVSGGAKIPIYSVRLNTAF